MTNDRKRIFHLIPTMSDASLMILCCLLTAVIFVTDLLIPLGVAGGVPYVAVVLIATRLSSRRYAFFFAIICTTLTILAFFFSPLGGEMWKVLANRFLALFAIWVTAILAIQCKQAEAFRILLEAAPDAMVIVNMKGEIVRINAQTEKLFGYSRNELIGQSLEILMPERFRNRHRKHVANYSSAPYTRFIGANLDLYALRKDGSEFPAEISLSPQETKEGVLVVSVIRDITDRKQTEEKLRNNQKYLEEMVELRTTQLNLEKKHVEQASQAKTDFLSTMSHELRTPLNSIIGFSEILRAKSFGPLSEKQFEYTGDILASGKHLLSLINDILDLSKIESGKMTLKAIKFNLRTLLGQSNALFQEKSLKHNIKFSTDIAKDVDCIHADERMIKQIIFNLLSNAFKFTPDGGQVGIEAKRNDKKETIVTVWDTGIGILKKDRNKIFQEFIQIENGAARTYGGTGLGLTLCKKMIKLHNGKIWLESEGKDKGSRFSFSLPETA